MATTQDPGPIQASIDCLRSEADRMVDMLRQRGGQALDAWGIKGVCPANFPVTDITESSDAVHLAANVPGVDPELLDVNITGQILRIHGSVAPSPHAATGTAHCTERHTGAFDRSFTLPCPVNAEAVQAEVANGVLQIRLPKTPDEVGFKVPVRPAP